MKPRRSSILTILIGAASLALFAGLTYWCAMLGGRMGPLGFDLSRFAGTLALGAVVTSVIMAIAAAPLLTIEELLHAQRLRRLDRGICPHCAYDSALYDPCPECGKPPRQRPPLTRIRLVLAIALGWALGALLGPTIAETQNGADEAAFKREFPPGSPAGWRPRNTPMGGELSYDPNNGYRGTDD